MVTKLEAAKIAIDSGIPCVIASGCRPGIISSLIKDPSSQGSLFKPKKGLGERERWLAFGARPKARVFIDAGAKTALLEHKSLLSVGIKSVAGNFEAGTVVSVADENNCEIARGKINISSRHLDKVKGIRSDKEVIHRDNIVIL